jgi:archaeosine-15-forming tRNA-guanine transglycosylase
VTIQQPIDMSNLDKVEFEAYNASVESKAKPMTDFAVARAGVRIVAVGVGLSDGRQIRSWQDQTAQPRPATLEKLRLLYRVIYIVDYYYGAETARAFLRSASPTLANRAPLEVIADDELADAQRAVLGAVRAFLEA